ncbi:MAG: hypothetical protein HeimC2_00960 [Candidatus Heimdallarchaeota archaeon LC_2]|nr:MAG: hypothetical protein HeimC2_00960 [Candidatus Heimdallarchaeota archaeon LC_2]
MWIQKIAIGDDKSITPVELLVLSVIDSKESITPSEIIHKIDEAMGSYHPRRGTIYPILKRLSDENLIESNESGKKIFIRTKLGTMGLSLSIETLLNSIRHTVSYFKLITESTISDDPTGAKDIISTLKQSFQEIQSELDNFESQISNKIDEEWHDIPLS